MTDKALKLPIVTVGLTRKSRREEVAPATADISPVGSATVEKLGGLVLTRHLGQSIMVGECIEIEVVAIKAATVRIRIAAPREVSVHRREVYEAILADHGSILPAPVLDRNLAPDAGLGHRGQGGLVLTRHVGESIMIGDEVAVEVVDIRPSAVRLRIAAPRSVSVHRREIFEAIHGEA